LLTFRRVIHREDYHRVLLQEAERLETKIRLGANVTGINLEKGEITIGGQETLKGDVVVGADGRWRLFYHCCECRIESNIFCARLMVHNKRIPSGKPLSACRNG
jgi:hypothetical protein